MSKLVRHLDPTLQDAADNLLEMFFSLGSGEVAVFGIKVMQIENLFRSREYHPPHETRA